MAKAWQSWESYHRINIRQKTMIMLMMPVISTLLHHRLRARSLFEECAWGFSFREKSRGTSYPPSTRDKFFDEFFWQGTKILVWKIHLILFIFISFYDNFYKRGIMGTLFCFQSWIKRPWRFQWQTKELWLWLRSSEQIQNPQGYP